ncbi:hypothetical protein VTN96DRAFT_9560 [Rasamsonia emersonii]|uniref:MT-A70 family n=1 Tax=Rasamsonia emersonii (strain ATCC 16479 / CBS 393.64 / IMI 116815) TaxID=1408163 RepID=A0A0F4Z406_RASE3|nr:MT-A70 family [Rasamsonia emersonii CBS 393.64]KKA25249.1 MT-A70 family [Rasamsonia emersonii CBS 393.64]
MATSSILYRNNEGTVFLIDIPTSIVLAQHLPSPSHQKTSSLETGRERPAPRKQLYSVPALETPFPSPPEPKSDAARARVLARIPVSERQFHEGIVSFVRQGLEQIRDSFEGVSAGAEKRMWCLPRKVMQREQPEKTIFSAEEPVSDEADSDRPTKKSRTNTTMGSNDGCHITRPLLHLPHEPKTEISGVNPTESRPGPPLILSPSVNEFESLLELRNVEVQNPSATPTVIRAYCGTASPAEESTQQDYAAFNIPPESCFVLCTLRMQSAQPRSHSPIPGLPGNRKFNLILLDPPWPNRSVRRAANYATHAYSDMDGLSRMIRDIILQHLHDGHQDHPDVEHQRGEQDLVAIWVTNKEKSRIAAYDAIRSAGLSVCEEWVWIKTTTQGEPVTPLDGLWRKPYEILVIGKRGEKDNNNRDDSSHTTGDLSPQRRLIAGVPDVHSRKPNLKELFEAAFFDSSSARGRTRYSALEVFARNLTAGWCACGDEVLKFNHDEWWFEE